MGQTRKLIFLKESLLEEIELQKKGIVNAEGILQMTNGISYHLEPAVRFVEEISGNGDLKKMVNTILTIKDIDQKGYDFYMDNVIIDESVYLIEQGFKGILIDKQEIKKDDLSDEQLLSKWVRLNL
ncbi:hypothetical protein JXR93_09275 [bacterium]|nr:hypothetical protein [bacterium]